MQTVFLPTCACARLFLCLCMCVCVCVCYRAPGGALSEVCSSQTADLLLLASPTPAAPWRDCVFPQLKTGFLAPSTQQRTFCFIFATAAFFTPTLPCLQIAGV